MGSSQDGLRQRGGTICPTTSRRHGRLGTKAQNGLTSPLVPWNTCGAFMAQTLGVATMAYLPFCFFNLVNPLVSAAYGFTGFTIAKAEPEESAPID